MELVTKIEQDTLEYEKHLDVDYFFEKDKNSVKDYICFLCKGVYFEPYVDRCGHIFCKECIFKYLSKYCECPISKEKQIINDLTFIGLLSDLLNSKQINCKNKKNECPWTGTLPEFENHVNIHCEKEEVSCDNKGCPEKLFRSNLNSHLPDCEYRMIKCEYCLLDIAFKELSSHHENCPKFIIPCEQNCKENIIREDMENHKKNFCMKTKIDCPFKRFGCNEEIKKESIEDHLKKEIMMHQLMMLGYINNKGNDKINFCEAFPDLKMIFKTKYENQNMEKEKKDNEKENKEMTDMSEAKGIIEIKNDDKKEIKKIDIYNPIDLKLFPSSNSLINLQVTDLIEKESLEPKKLLGIKRKHSESIKL